MSVEELTKSQIILLTLLVSFVTSIATGIVTVTLLDQAPPAVTQTINRVVERTVESVAPATTQGAGLVTKEVTVVVKEEDLMTDSIAKVSQSLVRIYQGGTEGTRDGFIGIGVIVTKEGTIATDGALIAEGAIYSIVLPDGKVVRTLPATNGSPIATLALNVDEPKQIYAPVAFASSKSLKLGQTVLALGGRERLNISTGIISALPGESTLLETNISSGISSGSPLINLFGEVVGMRTAQASSNGAGTYTASAAILKELSAAPTAAATTE